MEPQKPEKASRKIAVDSSQKKLAAPVRDHMPDVALKTDVKNYPPLAWVGMENIELPIQLDGVTVPAKITAQVSLDRQSARGIHMSRLYKLAQEKISQQELTLKSVRKLLREFLSSHGELSTSARIKIAFPWFTQRRALVSDNMGWRNYPVAIRAVQTPKGLRVFLQLQVTYSSTCPASAALARQLNAEAFATAQDGAATVPVKDVYDWLKGESGMPATPHAQRSFALLNVEIDPEPATGAADTFAFGQLIDLVEAVLGTPVQTVVKREDEQAFAFQNGQNLMFCEDAARRIESALQKLDGIRSFRGEVRHKESLHPHDAVCHFTSIN